MRIISKRRDFYDSALSHGIDLRLVFLRNTVEYEHFNGVTPELLKSLRPILEEVDSFPIKLMHKDPNRHKITQLREYSFDPVVVGFCGKLYFGYSCTDYGEKDVRGFNKTVHQYDLRKAAEFLPVHTVEQRHDTKRILEALSTSLSEYPSSSRGRILNYESWDKTIKKYETARYDQVFIDLGIPCFVLHNFDLDSIGPRRDPNLILNPILSDFGFQRVISPVQAFQEISMYLGNQLARQQDPKPINTGSDEILSQEKGFDEWSFRTHKADSKKNRKKMV